MAKRKILVLEKPGSPWHDFVREYFEDTSSSPEFAGDAKEASRFFGPQDFADVAFVNEALISLALSQRVKFHRETAPAFRLFRIGGALEKSVLSFDGAWSEPQSIAQFQRELVQYLPLPETVRVLVIDDEPEIGAMIRDYLDGRQGPAFEVLYARNGEQGFEVLGGQRPDVIVLDIKMPVMRGDEFYRRLRQKGIAIPVIVFFDAISGEEMSEIAKVGHPAVVDKGGHESAMPGMLTLIKKMVYFG